MAKQPSVAVLLASGGAAFAAYQFLYKPWLAAKAAGSGAAASTWPMFNPGPTPTVSTPTVVGPTYSGPGGQQGSIVDPRVNPGGDVGQAMWKKNWTQAQAATRLAALKSAFAQAKAAIAALQAPGANAPNVAAGLQLATANELAAANEDQAFARAVAAGDDAAAAQWRVAADAHRADAKEIRARVAAAQAAPDAAAQIAAWQGAMAGHAADYFALTGLQLA